MSMFKGPGVCGVARFCKENYKGDPGKDSLKQDYADSARNSIPKLRKFGLTLCSYQY